MNENLRPDSELLKRKETLLKAALAYNELACRLRQEAISIRFRLEGAEAYEVPLIGLANVMQIVPGSELTYVDLISQYVQSRNFERVYSASDEPKLGCLRQEDVGMPSLLERSALQIADDPASRLELEKFTWDIQEDCVHHRALEGIFTSEQSCCHPSRNAPGCAGRLDCELFRSSTLGQPIR